MSEVVEKLKAARELIARLGGWTREYAARDANGDIVDCRSKSAICFCVYGAMWAAGVSFDGGSEESIFETVIGGGFIGNCNDAPDRTQAEVVAAFDRAIKLAEAKS